MRIIAGKLGGRHFDSTARATHPMSEKMRGAIFNSLGDINNLTILDAFSGSGAIGFEAISRGASTASFVESNKNAQNDIEKNIRSLGLKYKAKLVKANIFTWIEIETSKFDIIVADPPYDKINIDRFKDIYKLLNSNGVFVLSLPGDHEIPVINRLVSIKNKNYSDSMLVFYKNNL